MNGTHLVCPCAIHGSVPWKVGKKKNWAALTHERHTFSLSMCRSWLSAMESWKKKWNADMTHMH